ncbi:TolC family protein [Psychrobacter sp. CAM01]|uniref:TolC family protein n=1 Tax=Psychrobacter sp. CAM01 TaxID=3080335 RepID=UPI002935F191|nr:TolC family protein [Psychrobacter sp. CAM01]MDV2860449.1 TolC family protein [Psychrobacter sp. CAM01]
MSASIVTHANTDTHVNPMPAPSHASSQDEMPAVAVTQIVEAEDSAAHIQATDDIRIAHSAMRHDNRRATQPLSTLIDPITHKTVDNSYALDVSSFLSLEQAQDILLQVSPKIAANDAAIAASEYQTDALKTLDNPLVFARVSASAYHVDEDIDLSSLRSGIVNEINNSVDGIVPSPVPDLPNFGELVGERLPDSYDFKRSGETTSAGLGVAWPIYTAGRTAALTGASRARTQEALADSILDKNALYNTLIERYFKAQLAIIAAYLRDDAYDTLKQTDHMAERLYEEGFISHVDRLEAQSALADAKSEAVKANNDARLAMIALQRLLRTDYRIKPTTPLFVSSRPLPDVSYFQDLALNNHPGLQKVAAKRAQAQQLHALSDTGYKPTVMLYGYGQVEKDPSWVAGISASWKLWGGLDKTASLASSSAQIRQADLSEIEVSDNLLLLVEKNWHDVNNAQARYQALQSNVDLAAEVLRLRRLGLQEGVNTTIEVVQAQTQALKARTEQAQAAHDYVQALAALMQSCGTPLAFNAYLNAADIQLPTLYTQQ